MTAELKTVDIGRSRGTYDIVADDGTVLRAGVSVAGAISDSTTVGTMKAFVTNHLTNNKDTFKNAWLQSQNLDKLNSMATAWGEAIL